MLMAADQAVLVLIDLQARLLPAVAGAEACLRRCRLLLAAARALAVPVLATEQYPQGLGPTAPAIAADLPPGAIFAKRHFNALREASLAHALQRLARRQVVLCGMESHVCVLQTALGLQQAHYLPCVAADAVASRDEAAKQLALARLRDHGVTVVNSEMVLFEWLQAADTASFRALLPLIKAGGPPA